MIIHEKISKHLEAFKAICSNHSVRYLYTFGSSVADSFDSTTSDIDLLIEIDFPDPLVRGEKLISLWDALEDFFQRKVDLLTESSIQNPFLRKSIDSTKILIYERSGQKVLV